MKTQGRTTRNEERRARMVSTRNRAFSLVELIAIIAMMVVIVAFCAPVLQGIQKRVKRTACTNNLKQIGIAFHSFATDHADRFPWQLPARHGGTMEAAQMGYSMPPFWVSQKHLTPKSIVCPADAGRNAPAAFVKGMGATNVSYFVALDATPLKADAFMCGDRNLQVNEQRIPPGMFRLRSQDSMGWTEQIHNHRGNLLLTDGSVGCHTNPVSIFAMHKQGVETNRLLLP